MSSGPGSAGLSDQVRTGGGPLISPVFCNFSFARAGRLDRQLFVRSRVSILSLALAACLLADDPSAAELFSRGRKAEKKGHMAEAYVFYSEAAALDPKNEQYWFRSQAVRSRAALEAKPVPSPATAGLLDPEPTEPPHFDSITARDLADARKPLPPSELKAQPGTKDFDLNGNAQMLFENVARSFGLDCVFDSEYQPGRHEATVSCVMIVIITRRPARSYRAPRQCGSRLVNYQGIRYHLEVVALVARWS